MLSIVVPVKAPPQAKSRLAAVLADGERKALVQALAWRTIVVARQAAPAARIILVSNFPEFRAMARSLGADALPDPGVGFNQALAIADAAVAPDDAMLVLPGDLPLLAADDVVAMISVDCDCAIAPDRTREGTNALFWRRAPRAFRFGAGSFSAHRQAADERSVRAIIVERHGLSFDIDEPQDYREFRADVRQSTTYPRGE